MFLWKEAPFLRILAPIIAGILLYRYAHVFPLWVSVFSCCILLIFLLVFKQLSHFTQFRYKGLKGVILLGFLFCASYFLCQIRDPLAHPLHYINMRGGQPFLKLVVLDPPLSRERTVKLRVEMMELADSFRSTACRGQAFLYLEKEKNALALQEGEVLWVRNTLTCLEHSYNPGSFNYAAYCREKGIAHTAYIRNGEWTTCGHTRISLPTYFSKMSKRCRSILQRYISDSSALGIAEALLLGYRHHIDATTWQDYSNTGIAHIIAISGMHMAMIYGSVRYLLLLIPFFRQRKRYALLCALTCMWIFAALTGFPASVSRAALMFSFICWAELQDRPMNIFNTLCASAFVLLCYQPMLLFDAGLQLSYAAVLSLVIFYHPIQSLYHSRFRLLQWTWQLMAATFAAQVLTLPLSLYYFHQFPLLFLLSNLLAVPVSTCILYTEIVLVLLSPFESIAMMLGNFTGSSIVFLNSYVAILCNLPYSLLKNISIDLVQVVLLYLLVYCVYNWLKKINTAYVVYSLGVLFMFAISFLLQEIRCMRQDRLLVYKASGIASLEFIRGSQYMNFDSLIKANRKNHMRYVTAASHAFFRVSPARQAFLKRARKQGIELYRYKGRTVVRIFDASSFAVAPLRVNILIISSMGFPSEHSLNGLKADLVVLDNLLPEKARAAWIQFLETAHYKYYDLVASGALIINL